MQHVMQGFERARARPIPASEALGAWRAADAADARGAGGERRPPPFALGSVFPRDAQASIHRLSKSATTSGRARSRNWVLRFDRRTPAFVEPLMGWTGGDDTLTQVELAFPTREAAVAYATRQGIDHRVAGDACIECRSADDPQAERRALEETFAALALFAWAQARYGRCDLPDAPGLDEALSDPAGTFASPQAVVNHPLLTLDCKREILRRWAWDEVLLQVASDEAMPEGRPTRLDEVKAALLALETGPVIGVFIPLGRQAGRAERRKAAPEARTPRSPRAGS